MLSVASLQRLPEPVLLGVQMSGVFPGTRSVSKSAVLLFDAMNLVYDHEEDAATPLRSSNQYRKLAVTEYTSGDVRMVQYRFSVTSRESYQQI